MIIAIDFDGTIVEHKYPRVGDPVPGAIQWMRRFSELGAKLILYTMRSDDALKDAVEHCHTYGVEFWGVNTNPEQARWTQSPKTYAHVYIDDAAFGCPLLETSDRPIVDWGIVGPTIEKQLLRCQQLK